MKKKCLIVFLFGIFFGFVFGYIGDKLFNNVKPSVNFDYDNKVVILNNGLSMPIYGISTYGLSGKECYDYVSKALRNGVRLIDTAYIYGNEDMVGKAINESKVSRKDIFVVTKLYPNQYDKADKAIEESLKKLDIGYIDMMMLQHPGSDDIIAYKSIEKFVKSGKIKSIGLSNYYIDELKYLIPSVDIKPSLVQSEIHPYNNNSEVVDYIHSLGIVVQSGYPLGGNLHRKYFLNDSLLVNLSLKYKKSVIQIILRWDLQNNVSVVPISVDFDSFDLFDFEISDEDMKKINNLNKNKKFGWY